MGLFTKIFMPPTLETFRKVLDSVEADIIGDGPLYHRYRENSQKEKKRHPFLEAQRPESTQHFHLLGPTFSVGPKDTDIHPIYPFCLLRDGFVPLVKFLSTKNLYSHHLLINEDLSFLVPPQKEERVYLYTIRPRMRRTSVRKNKILVTGILNGASFSLEYFTKQIRKMGTVLKKKSLNWEQVYFLFFVRKNIFFSVRKEEVNLLILYIKELHRLTNGKAQFLAEDALSYIDDFSDWFYVCLHENSILIADNYLEHLLLSKGGFPLITKRVKKKESGLAIPASPYHDYVVKPFCYKKEMCRFKEVDTMLQFFSEESMESGSFFFYAREILSEML